MHDAPKTTLRERIGAASQTTYQDLQAANNSGVNALLNGVSADEKAALSHSTTSAREPATALTPPAIGQYWTGQGGVYVGSMLDGETQIHLIMATKAFHGEWGSFGETIPGEFSRSNGQHNTTLILSAEPNNELLQEITTYAADGHSDFYLPATFENNLICINAQDHIEKCWHWNSTQYSADLAWSQNFEDGFQSIDCKDSKLAARAVRRLPI